MKREFYSQHSDVLNENMSMIVYGEGGYPVIAFQCQDSKSNNFEDFGMIDVLAPFIEEGRIQLFSVDNLDEQSWSDEGGDKGARAWRQEQYFQFVTDELLPRVHAWNNSDRRPLAVGCSMGATHAAIAALRRPDLFQGCIALSGVYSTRYFFGDWMDENLYNNDVPAFLTNMPADHPYVNLYNQRQLVMCVGQGAWELGIDDLHYIDGQLNRLGVKHWCDFWGTDVNHDWPWWRKQMPYFMNEVLADIEGQAKAEPAAQEPALIEEAKPEAEAVASAEPEATAAVTEEAKPAEKVVHEAPKATAKKPAAKRTTTRKAAAQKADETAAEAEPSKKPAAKRTTTRKTTTKKAAAPATEAAATEAAATEAKPATKRTTTRKAATTKKAAEAKAETSAAATEPAAETTKKPAAKRTTTRKTTAKKATETANEAVASEAKPAAKRTTTRRTTKKADAAE